MADAESELGSGGATVAEVGSPNAATVYEVYDLMTTKDKFYVVPVDLGSVPPTLVIDRVTQQIFLRPNEIIPSDAKIKRIYGIFGLCKLVAGAYLIVITQKEFVGHIFGNDIYRVAGTEILPLKESTLHLTDQQVADNSMFLSMIELVLNMNGFYFSITFDLTHSLARLNNAGASHLSKPLFERADPRFVWNGHLLRELTQMPELNQFCMPIMMGFISISDTQIQRKPLRYILISRRSCLRAGVRFYMRGIDLDGCAANFNETEQIIQYDGIKCSFMQTRGSVPLYWSQKPDLKYKPNPILSSSDDHVDGLKRHFIEQKFNYGDQTLINLLDQKGLEERLVLTYANTVEASQIPGVRHEAFDFHKECKKMRYDKLSILMERVKKEQVRYGYFMMDRDGTVKQQQEGVFRTNCIDCLDRTNVVQSLLARQSLKEQFLELGLLEVGQQVSDQLEFEIMFKNVWADNADAIAKVYSGTGALKTDFTRTGKRTILGALQDGYNSLVRYLMNNFYDGYRQDAIDFFLGRYKVDEHTPSLYKTGYDWKFFALPTICVVAMAMCIISILIPDEHAMEQYLYILFWGSASMLSLVAIRRYGRDFVNGPRLVPEKSKTE